MSALPTTIIQGIRLENWVNAAWDVNPKLRILGVLVPVGMLKSPLDLSIIRKIEKRLNAYESLMTTMRRIQGLVEGKIESKTTQEMLDEIQELVNKILTQTETN